MKTSVFGVAIAILVMHVSVSLGQFDLGGLIQQKADQVIGRIENRLQESIPIQVNPFPPTHQILPYPYPPIESPMPVAPTPIGPPQYSPAPIEIPHNGMPQPTPGIGVPTVEYVQPVAPVYSNPPQPAQPAPKPKPATRPAPKVDTGDIVNINGRSYGSKVGKVYLKIDSLLLRTTVLDWKEGRVSARLPYLPIEKATQALVVVVNSDDIIADKTSIVMVPADPPAQRQTAKKPPVAPQVFPGQKLNIRGDFGESTGKVELRLGGASMTTKLVSWARDKVVFELPGLQLSNAQDATVVVVGQQGKELRTVNVRFAPGKSK